MVRLWGSVGKAGVFTRAVRPHLPRVRRDTAWAGPGERRISGLDWAAQRGWTHVEFRCREGSAAEGDSGARDHEVSGGFSGQRKTGRVSRRIIWPTPQAGHRTGV